MLDTLLEQWGMDYQGFSKFLEIDYKTLWAYRMGKREFRLNMEQIQRLESLLKQVGMDFSKLPSDWIRDIEPKEDK